MRTPLRFVVLGMAMAMCTVLGLGMVPALWSGSPGEILSGAVGAIGLLFFVWCGWRYLFRLGVWIREDHIVVGSEVRTYRFDRTALQGFDLTVNHDLLVTKRWDLVVETAAGARKFPSLGGFGKGGEPNRRLTRQVALLNRWLAWDGVGDD